MFCKYCGKQTRENAKFCGACGKPITAALPRPPEAAATATQTPLPPHPEARHLNPEVVAATIEVPKTLEPVPTPGPQIQQRQIKGKLFIAGVAITVVLVIAIA